MKTIIAERLRELRGQSSLREMAEAIGIKYSAWARYEAGGSLPGADILARICCAHAVSADWLLGIDNLRKNSVNAGDNSAVAIGTNARATVSRAAPGERPDCKACPHMAKLRKLEEIMGK